MGTIAKFVKYGFKICNAEFILEEFPNGGGVIAFRSAWITIVLFCIAVGVYDFISDDALICLDVARFLHVSHEKFQWLGAIFLATYVALYSRFSAQWSYLAGLYNQIMLLRIQFSQKEPAPLPATKQWAISLSMSLMEERFAVWMAAFIADSMEMHLAKKTIFSGCVRSMLAYKGVREAFIDGSPENEAELRDLISWLDRNNK